ncbi:cytochrome b5 [Conidiobolus coronatus NRRL 28638]|uniref:Cytochrome b5 n=1 Tax=Conidiobolus coronatus (strain ATCC 28846 / CBS 209.66 / NRRL 28638) TaxID=796925 RepID=A0A137PBI6_CONC2|nr:cytochrome b5 [Conidiobolus coronatus NRRL 28638]|eukprot:KXN72373.1 cytochrome b5 [Conidiobolus coronatus NRRL 28638]
MSEKIFTEKDLQDNKSKHSLWITVNGKVYDATPFQNEHPGGDMVLLEYGGRDATETFLNLPHSDDAKKILQSLYIGELDEKTKLKYEADHVSDDIKVEYNPKPPKTPG